MGFVLDTARNHVARNVGSPICFFHCSHRTQNSLLIFKYRKPKNARSKRAFEKKAPQVHENPRTTLFLRGTSSSRILQLAMTDLVALKRPFATKFTKKNEIHPFESATSLEFFSEKNDASLLVFGHHSKKRPHSLTFVRCFDHKVLDMLELYIDPESFRTLSQFKNTKCAVGLKPLIAFSGTPFESPTQTKYTLAKSLLLDFFRGQEAGTVDVEGLQYIVHISAGEEVEGEPAPQIHLRVYLIKTKRSGQKLPRVEVEEMGPRVDFRVGREKLPEEAAWKESLKKPKGLEVFLVILLWSWESAMLTIQLTAKDKEEYRDRYYWRQGWQDTCGQARFR